ncbi:MAG: hypothetical protein JWM93_2133 [Frankiales bacterium]|nr:hypothetical protein [Frankiales bacterium]
MTRVMRTSAVVLALLTSLAGCTLMTSGERPVDLDFAAPLDVAVAAAEDAGYEVVGFEFANGNVYGGFPMDGMTVDEALAEFELEYETVPVVVKITVTNRPMFARPIVTGLTEDFTAPDAVMPGMSEGDIATYLLPGPGGASTSLAGTLVLADACTYFDDDEGTRWLPVFSEGATWWDGDLYDGPNVYAAGQPVTLDGAEGSADVGTIPDACDVTLPIWVVRAER